MSTWTPNLAARELTIQIRTSSACIEEIAPLESIYYRFEVDGQITGPIPAFHCGWNNLGGPNPADCPKVKADTYWMENDVRATFDVPDCDFTGHLKASRYSSLVGIFGGADVLCGAHEFDYIADGMQKYVDYAGVKDLDTVGGASTDFV